MENKSDAILRKMLKKWVNRQHPPDNGRARLLWEASHISPNKIRPYLNSVPSSGKTLFLFI